MSEKMRDVMIERFTDILMLTADVITAPVLAVYRVTSDFVHHRGRYSRLDRGSPGPHRDAATVTLPCAPAAEHPGVDRGNRPAPAPSAPPD